MRISLIPITSHTFLLAIISTWSLCSFGLVQVFLDTTLETPITVEVLPLTPLLLVSTARSALTLGSSALV